jgi:Domain of unknown function (DUF4440)
VGTEDADEREAVIAAELERCRAVSEQDWETLDALLDDTLTHTHMNGRVDDKGALVASLGPRPRTLSRGELSVRVYGDSAVMTGPQYLGLGGGTVTNQATETWIRRDGRWVLVAFHASTDDPTPR